MDSYRSRLVEERLFVAYLRIQPSYSLLPSLSPLAEPSTSELIIHLQPHLTMSDSTRLKSTVYVGGLDQAATAQTLAEAFVPFGEIVDISLPKPDAPNSSDKHRGFGYVEFDLPQDAKEAIDNMDGSEIYGRTIKVAPAKPQKDANEGLGSKTAIWEQVRILSAKITLHRRMGSNKLMFYRRVT